MRCDNCGADVPKGGRDSQGRQICCAHCIFNPLGCRCRFGEYGVAETFINFDVDDEDEEQDDDSLFD